MKEPNNIKAPILCQKAVELLKRHQPETALKLSETETLNLIQRLEENQLKMIRLNQKLKLAQKQTQIAVEKYTELYDFAPSGYCTLSKEGEIIELNHNGANLLGKKRIHLAGCQFSSFVTDDTKPIFDIFLRKIFDSQTEETCGVTLLTANNSPIYVHLSGHAAIDKEQCLLNLVDITSHKQTQDTLLKSEEQFRALTQTANDAIITINVKGIVLGWNRGAEQIFGYSEEEITGKELRIIIPQQFAGDHNKNIDRVASGDRHVIGKTIEISGLHKSGHEFPIELSLTEWETKSGKFFTCIIRDITERKFADQTLRKNEEKYRLLFQNMSSGFALHEIILDPDGRPCDYRFLELNPAFEKLTGLKASDLVGKTVREVMPHTESYWIDLYGKVALAGTSISFENYSSELKKHFQVNSYSPEPGKFAALFFDLTERKNAEKQLKLLSRAIEQSPVTVVITDKNGNIEYTNPKFTEITGYTIAEVQGKSSRLLQSGKQNDEFYQNLWNTILVGNDWHGEFQNRKKNGELYWESAVISSILDNQGEIAFFFAVKEDITEKKKMLEDLITSKVKAEESDRLKSAFLANMSHEIRTPMNGILGFADLLKQPNLTATTQKEYISIIEQSGARLLSIINDIVDISKIESGLMKLAYSKTDVNEQIEYIYSFFRPEIEKKGVKISFNTGLPSKEAVINTDSDKIYAVLINLVKNAIKFTPTGSIELGYQKVDNFLQFFVRDTGIGIRPNLLNTIFERFRQGSDFLTRNYEGAGLGLSISKAYVEMLGGKIWVESEEKKGSVFYFTIPYTVQ